MLQVHPTNPRVGDGHTDSLLRAVLGGTTAEAGPLLLGPLSFVTTLSKTGQLLASLKLAAQLWLSVVCGSSDFTRAPEDLRDCLKTFRIGIRPRNTNFHITSKIGAIGWSLPLPLVQWLVSSWSFLSVELGTQFLWAL